MTQATETVAWLFENRVRPTGKSSSWNSDRSGLPVDVVFPASLRWSRRNCRIYELQKLNPEVLFISRSPELITLTILPTQSIESKLTVVYPEPPLGADEVQFILKVRLNVQLISFAD